MASECTLCTELVVRSSRAPWNEPLVESENFVVLPSLGALVEGWLLVIPKEHYLSMGALPISLREEADQLENDTRVLLKAAYKSRIVTFEHGPSAANHGTGCGVDHAHLHLLPLNCDLLQYVRPFLPEPVKWEECNWDGRTDAHRRGLDYLYLKQEGADGLRAVSADFGSQVFRKAVSSYLGRQEQFSWHGFPQLRNVAKTIRTVTGVLSHRQILGLSS